MKVQLLILYRFFFLSVLFVMNYVTGQAQAPYILSERTGATIDSAERSYFLLFPYIRHLRIAQLTSLSDTTVRVAGKKHVGNTIRDTSFVVPTKDLQRVGSIIDHYEQFGQRDSIPDFASLQHLIAPSYPAMTSSAFEVTLHDGTTYVNDVFALADSGLYLWDKEKEFHWQTPSDNTHYISSSEIYRLQNPSYPKQLFIGSLVGGGLGLGIGKVVYNESESLVSGVSSVFGSASLGIGIAHLFGGQFTIVDGSQEKFRGQFSPLFQVAATQNRIPPELMRQDGSIKDVKTSFPSSLQDMALLRSYTKNKQLAIEVGVQSKWVLKSQTPLTVRLRTTPQVRLLQPHVQDAFNIRLLWRPFEGIGLFAEASALPSLSNKQIVDTIPLHTLFGLGLNACIELIGKEQTKGRVEIVLQPEVGLHLNQTKFNHSPGTGFTGTVAYDETFLTVSPGLALESHIYITKALSLFNRITPTYHIPFGEFAKRELPSLGGNPTVVFYDPLKLEGFGSIEFNVGVSYDF